MSQENVEIVRQLYEAANQRDFDVYFERLALRNGQALRMDAFPNKQEALEAVGLSEQDVSST